MWVVYQTNSPLCDGSRREKGAFASGGRARLFGGLMRHAFFNARLQRNLDAKNTKKPFCALCVSSLCVLCVETYDCTISVRPGIEREGSRSLPRTIGDGTDAQHCGVSLRPAFSARSRTGTSSMTKHCLPLKALGRFPTPRPANQMRSKSQNLPMHRIAWQSSSPESTPPRYRRSWMRTVSRWFITGQRQA